MKLGIFSCSINYRIRKNIEYMTNAMRKDSLNTDFYAFEEILDILEPFCEMTVTYQPESMTPITMVVPSIAHIIDHLKQMRTTVIFL
jgi:hypothetical protein